ncbi:MAG: methylated-DNA--[protein]-cysteine S-methyltransferase [Desulfobacterales bacterium]|nr:methylated-DNA--[protein]-cysteine S-methyltransferase [Desulfobacterales bacterium]
MMKYSYAESPIGKLLLYGGQCLEGLMFPKGKTRKDPEPDWVEDPDAFSRVKEQLDLYFQGKLTRFDLEMRFSGTDFQKQVWQALTRIPYGETISYGELAGRIGNPKASRAVGLANGKNPIPIIVPCHRVIGKNGKLTGFGGGLDVKAFLLDLEKNHG